MLSQLGHWDFYATRASNNYKFPEWVYLNASDAFFNLVTFYKQMQPYLSSDLVGSAREVKSHLARWNYLGNKYV